MKLISNIIPNTIFFDKNITNNAKLLYIYLLSKCDDNGVCHGVTSTSTAHDLWVTLRSVQMSYKTLVDFGVISKVRDKYGNTCPKIDMSSDRVPIANKKRISEAKLTPSKTFLKIIEVWNQLFDTNVIYSVDLYKLYLERVENIEEVDVLKAIKNRYNSLKNSSEFKDPSKRYFKTSMKNFLRDHDSVDMWINNSGSAEDDLKKFNFYS